MKQFIACCGLDCEMCDARIATLTNDDALREATARKWSEMNNTPEITADHKLSRMPYRGVEIRFLLDVRDPLLCARQGFRDLRRVR